MTPQNDHLDARDQQLWELYRASAAALGDTGPAEPTDLALAAWLDGTCSDEQAQRVESAMAAGRIDAREVLAIRDLLEIGEPAEVDDGALSRMIARAQQLHTTNTSPSLNEDDHHGVIAVFPAARRIAAVAAAIAICVVGWRAGQMLASPGATAASIDSTTLASEMTFGLFDPDDSEAEFIAFELTSFASREDAR